MRFRCKDVKWLQIAIFGTNFSQNVAVYALGDFRMIYVVLSVLFDIFLPLFRGKDLNTETLVLPAYPTLEHGLPSLLRASLFVN